MANPVYMEVLISCNSERMIGNPRFEPTICRGMICGRGPLDPEHHMQETRISLK